MKFQILTDFPVKITLLIDFITDLRDLSTIPENGFYESIYELLDNKNFGTLKDYRYCN